MSTPSLARTTRALNLSLALFGAALFTACGSADFSKGSKKQEARNEALAGEQDPGCLKLGADVQHGGFKHGGRKHGGPGYFPGKGQDDYHPGKGDVGVYPPPAPAPLPPPPPPPAPLPLPPGKGDEGVNPPPPGSIDGHYPKSPCANNPGQNPGQHPGQAPGYPGQIPGQIPGKGPNYPGQNPGQYPTQNPIDPHTCGKGAKYCDDGGPGQWPPHASHGDGYDRGDVEACLGAFRSQGYDTKGQWNVVVREAQNVSVLSNTVFEDVGNEPSIVLIKTVNILGRIDFRLLNPNALYCIKSVSVLEKVNITSCYQSNVVFGEDVSVLSGARSQVVDCR